MATTAVTIEPIVPSHSSVIQPLGSLSTSLTRSDENVPARLTNVTTDNDVVTPAPTSSLRPTQSWKSFRPALSWKAFKSRMTSTEKAPVHLGWLIAFIGLLFTVVALSPAFKSQSMSERALQLAEWTALKDFIEECREEIAAGIDSQACMKVLNTQLPPPPYVKSGLFDRMRRGLFVEHMELNGTLQALQGDIHEPLFLSTIHVLVMVIIILTACTFVFLGFDSTRSRRLQHFGTDESMEELYEQAADFSAMTNVDSVVVTTTVRHPPSAAGGTLRQRVVRTHPIYRHTTLDEAIHAADLSEIRMRLHNGEDVNQHWPYLIYRLAISPKAPDMAERIEVARLCLDFGAEVNALKGWNGQSALLIAIHFGNVAVAKLLIANGAMVGYSPPDSHLTALHRCVRLAATGSSIDALEIMEMLCKHGANVNQVDRLNESPLHKLLIDSWYARHDDATFEKLFSIALCLVEYGADMPVSLKERFTVRNPLYEFVQAAIWERSKRLASGRKFKRDWQLWTEMEGASLIVNRALQLRPQPKVYEQERKTDGCCLK